MSHLKNHILNKTSDYVTKIIENKYTNKIYITNKINKLEIMINNFPNPIIFCRSIIPDYFGHLQIDGEFAPIKYKNKAWVSVNDCEDLISELDNINRYFIMKERINIISIHDSATMKSSNNYYVNKFINNEDWIRNLCSYL
jgi:hypothetical protein